MTCASSYSGWRLRMPASRPVGPSAQAEHDLGPARAPQAQVRLDLDGVRLRARIGRDRHGVASLPPPGVPAGGDRSHSGRRVEVGPLPSDVASPQLNDFGAAPGLWERALSGTLDLSGSASARPGARPRVSARSARMSSASPRPSRCCRRGCARRSGRRSSEAGAGMSRWSRLGERRRRHYPAGVSCSSAATDAGGAVPWSGHGVSDYRTGS